MNNLNVYTVSNKKFSKKSFYHGIILGMLSNEGKSSYSVISNSGAVKDYLEYVYLRAIE